MIFTHSYCHHNKKDNLYVYLNYKKVLTIKNIKKMATLSITVTDNQADLDALKAQIKSASDALTSTIQAAQTALAALEAFEISFTVSAPSVS